MWIMPDRFNPQIPFSIELVLQDSKGDRIHGTIGKYVLKFFRNKIHELRLYRMNYFVVGPNNLKLRTTTHKLKLTFTQKTFVEETNDPSFHMNIFNLRPFHQLKNEHDVDETELLDVVGQVVTYEDVKTYNQGDDQSFLINVVLEDDQRNRIMATLWSELVDQIQHHLNESADEPVIVVFQHMKPQKYRGNYSVRSCWYQTKIWINSTLPQSIEFKSRLLAARQSNIERITRTSSQQSYSVTDELDKGIVLFKTIRDLVQCTQESSYWIAAKLVNLELDRGWSYLACNKCSRKVEKVENKYFCAKCNEEESFVTHRYRLQVRVMDGTAFISLLLWNREAMQLIGKSAKELKERLVETSLADAECSYPSEMDDILYKKFMFKVIVKQENIESQVEVYKVLKFTDDDDLLKEYDHTLFEDNMNDPHFLDGQSSSGDKLFGDLMAESQLKSVLQTPIEKSVSESGSSVLDDGDACNAKISPLKTYDKKTRSANKASAVATDDDFNSQLSSNKVRRVVKKEKNP
ncbi:replication protein A 70 kDa DNA-binding subunit B-like isoform X1 [Nicotiana tabacum]|uniref:Replication protein A 70 kDa DNA-binding subunit B-like isoform X1 n=2 Tax=Nicotiana tabacum TaxID=4097 RepID=A0AC58S0D4_TOBAC